MLLSRRRPMSFMNRPGRSIILSMGQLRRRLPRTLPALSSTVTRCRDARRNAWLVIAAVFIATAGHGRACAGDTTCSVECILLDVDSRRTEEFASTGSTLAAVGGWASPFGTALLAPPRRRSRSPRAVSAHSRDDPLATVSTAVVQQPARFPVSLPGICSLDGYGLT